MEESPLKLKRTPVKRRQSTAYNKSIIREVETGETTRKASEKGISTFVSALKSHIESGDSDIDKYVDSIVEYDSDQELRRRDSNSEIYWHKSCYSFTSKDHLSRLRSQQASRGGIPGTSSFTAVVPSSSKIHRRPFYWNELCFFCEQKSNKKDRTLINVATFDFWSNLENRANEEGDVIMNCKVGDYSKLIANGAKCHKGCYCKYIKKDESTGVLKKGENVYNTALERLINNITPQIKAGKALLLTDLLIKYQAILIESMTEAEANSYTTQKLKMKLTTQYIDKLRIVSSNRQGNHDFVVDKNLKLEDVINSAAKFKEALKSAEIECDLAICDESEQTTDSVLFHAALILRTLKKDSTGTDIHPLDASNVGQEQEEKIVPSELYSFVYWVVSDKRSLSSEVVDMNLVKTRNPILHQKILSLCQDIMYLRSRGKCRTPKHIGLSLAIHQLTQSKDAVVLVNRNGHGISYEELERIDTSWAKEQQSEAGITVPSNMKPGLTIRAAGDNFNRATECLDGKHLDIVNMVLYQLYGDSNTIQGNFAPTQKPLTERSKTLKDMKSNEILECPHITGKQPGPSHLLRNVNLDWFFSCSEAHKDART